MRSRRDPQLRVLFRFAIPRMVNRAVTGVVGLAPDTQDNGEQDDSSDEEPGQHDNSTDLGGSPHR